MFQCRETHLGRDKWPPVCKRHFQMPSLLKENVRISVKFPPKFVPKGQINRILALFQVIAPRLIRTRQWCLDYQCIYGSLGHNELMYFVSLEEILQWSLVIMN